MGEVDISADAEGNFRLDPGMDEDRGVQDVALGDPHGIREAADDEVRDTHLPHLRRARESEFEPCLVLASRRAAREQARLGSVSLVQGEGGPGAVVADRCSCRLGEVKPVDDVFDVRRGGRRVRCHAVSSKCTATCPRPEMSTR